MPLRSGDLRHQVEIRRPTRTRLPTGGYQTTWTSLGTFWAQVTGQIGREALIGEALNGVAAYQVRIQQTPFTQSLGIKASDQVRYGSIDLNIKSIADPDGLREQFLIIADTSSAQAT